MDEYFCPNCGATLNDQSGFDPDNRTWRCTSCGQCLMGDDIYEGDTYEGVAWFCDNCGALLNRQSGFSDGYGSWECTECGHINGTSKNDISPEYDYSDEYDKNDNGEEDEKLTCPNCGAVLAEQWLYADYEDNWKCTECGAHLHHYYSDDSYTIVKSEGDDEDCDDEDCDDDEHLPISAWKPKRSTTSNAKKISAQPRSNAVSKRGRVFCKVMLFINAIVLACVLLVIILTNEISLIPTLSFFGVLTIMFYVISKTPKKAKHLFGRTTGVRKWSFILICLVALYALPRLAESMLDIASHIPIQRGLSAMGSIVTTHDSVATPEYVYDVVLTGDAVITDYCGSDDSIFIPSELGGHSVIRIADYAFKDCINLKSVSMWADITEIGDYAFVGCSELSKISIPNSTKKIGSHAFEGCESLCDVTLWNAGSIGEYAFAGCVSLSDIRIPTDTSVIGAHAFEKCTGLVSLSIWDAKKIEEYAFAGCTGLTEISVPSETEIIGAHAFDGCINLEKVSLRNRSMQVDSTAFSNCPKLERKPN